MELGGTEGTPAVTLVVASFGEGSLAALLEAVGTAAGPPPAGVVIVDDRPGPDREPAPPLDLGDPGPLAARVEVRRGPRRGPAAARNLGWQVATTPWVVFLAEDAGPAASWRADLARDLARAAAGATGATGLIAGVRGHVDARVDGTGSEDDADPDDRGATPDGDGPASGARDDGSTPRDADWAYRRDALATLGGFDERLRFLTPDGPDRGHLELGLRIRERGWRVAQGERRVSAPPRHAPGRADLRLQRVTVDDALLDAVHGVGWRTRTGSPTTAQRTRHLATAGGLALGIAGGIAAAVARRRAARPLQRAGTAASVIGTMGWLGGTGALVAARLPSGARGPVRIAQSLSTSVALPLAATWWAAVGAWRARRAGPWRAVRPALVLFDRDSALIEAGPPGAGPAAVRLRIGAKATVARLARHGVGVAIISDQRDIAQGRTTIDETVQVNRRIAELVGNVDGWFVCPHSPEDGCACRMPGPGLVHEAIRTLDVAPQRCAVVGGRAAAVGAAVAAGARGVLVPDEGTSPLEVASAVEVADSLENVAARLLAGPPPVEDRSSWSA